MNQEKKYQKYIYTPEELWGRSDKELLDILRESWNIDNKKIEVLGKLDKSYRSHMDF